MTVPAVGHADKHFWERRETEHQLSSAQIGALFEQLSAHLSGIRSALLAPPLDDVVYNGVVKIGPDGTSRFTVEQPLASIRVTNYSAGLVTVTYSDGGSVPTEGRGIARIPSGFARTFPMRGTTFVIFGTPGTFIDVEAYFRPRDPSGGACGTVA